jgi:predicted small lipoprotein YifL
MQTPCLNMPWVVVAAALALGGCGLKGSLTLPPQSEQIVIRPAPSGEGPTVPTEGAPATGTAAPPAGQRITVPDERLPPPPLPGGNPGTARGG